jgi:hypothetical protein
VHLDEGVQADVQRKRVQLGQLVVVEGGRDQQDGVGAHDAGVAHVSRRHGEVLAQHRQPCRGPGRPQVLRGAREELPVGEDRQAAGPAPLVGTRQGGGIEAGGQVALGRGTALDLGHHPHALCGPQGRGEAPGRRLGPGLDHQRRQIPAVHLRCGPVGGEDAVEVGGHRHRRPEISPPRP